MDETRLYARWAEGETNEESGLIGARRVLNQLHAKLAKEGFDQVRASLSDTFIENSHVMIGHMKMIYFCGLCDSLTVSNVG